MGARVDNVERRRASLTNRPTLNPLPGDEQCIHFSEGSYCTVTGADGFDEAVAFRDSTNGLIDAWVGVGADIVEWSADLAGYPDAQFEQIVDQLGRAWLHLCLSRGGLQRHLRDDR